MFDDWCELHVHKCAIIENLKKIYVQDCISNMNWKLFYISTIWHQCNRIKVKKATQCNSPNFDKKKNRIAHTT